MTPPEMTAPARMIILPRFSGLAHYSESANDSQCVHDELYAYFRLPRGNG
jgi:hypothetical protein